MFHITWGLGQAVHQAPSNILVWLLKGKSGGGIITKYLVKKEHNLRFWGYVLMKGKKNKLIHGTEDYFVIST